MVLASTDTGKGLGELAQLADKIMEVATPPVASVTRTNSSEVTQFHSEIGELCRLVEQMLSTSQLSRRRASSVSKPGSCLYISLLLSPTFRL